ncbi:MAG: two pore domain potassium channel family protein [Deltaproteobacteria bacterium]|nr:two pore domain potassium channel family protein [Deltaproteobacteria bacterium]
MPFYVLIGAIVTAVLVILVVGVHYEMLSLISNGVRRLKLNDRLRVGVAVLAALGAHFIEVILFAIGWKILILADVAHLSIEDPTFVEILYFSASTYTSLGYGDIVPIGISGLLAGSEALTGLVLIAWTASFTYFEMHAFWDHDGDG